MTSRTVLRKTMKAYVYNDYGNSEVMELQELATPQPEDDGVVLRVHASSVNPFEWHMMTGTPAMVRLTNGLRRPKNNQLGADVSGTVVAVGNNVTEFAVGDEVFGRTGHAYAEFAHAKEGHLVRKPQNLSFEEMAGVGIAAYTALQGLRLGGEISPGHKVLINGASGGVGTYAVQIAKAMGAEVTAVCSTRNLDMVRSLGANHVVDYTAQDFLDTEERYDLFFDAVGVRPVLACRRVLTDGGRYVAASVPKRTLAILGRVLRMPIISTLGNRKLHLLNAKFVREDLFLLAEMMEAGKVKTVIDRTYGFDQIPSALSYQGEGHAQGKTIISVIPTDQEG